jgi:hypothetical protein
MKQTAHEVNMRIAGGYWRIRRFTEAAERAKRVAHEQACCRIFKEAKALQQAKHERTKP